ncbi:PP2C family serine/threonine-protein phosphatase [Aeromonas caviae]|uniref:PP2C family protein-serine/threonine phosphatase n=1 Tax=Aeromonas TaxID=642 RepID=UPI00107040FF|nr:MULTISPECIES: protein phosphatase 2C domain-containing protein [Aeromonas]TFF76607.1 serine/threonine-protein phosphatase [Aeromonas taiwanensis]
MISMLSCGLFSYAKTSSRTNQDTVLAPHFIKQGYLLAIADGVGSYSGAEHASSSAIQGLLHGIGEGHIDNLDFLFASIKNAVSELSEKNALYREAATTLTFAYINSFGLYIGHIGDCRLYINSDSKLEQLTKDHTQHQMLLDQNLYSKKELKNLGGKNTLTSAISKDIPLNFQSKFIPIEDLVRDSDEINIYIMSDGAHHHWDLRPRFADSTIKNPNCFTASLYKRILRNGPVDDYSLVVAKFKVGSKSHGESN